MPAEESRAVAVCAIVRDEALYIEEWVTFHRSQGVTQFRIYDNASVDGTPEILRQLGIEPAIWAGQPHDFDAQQRAAYIEAARMLAGHAQWVAFIDVDEFLFGREGTLAEALEHVPGDVGAIAVQQVVFGSGGQQTRTPQFVTKRFTLAASREHPECRWFKSIARPEAVAHFDSVHSVVLSFGRYVMADGSTLTRTSEHPGEASRRIEGNIGLHHYSLKSFEEFRAKKAKWASRSVPIMVSDEYFFNRERYANEHECRELVDLSGVPSEFADSGEYKESDVKVTFVQTADPFDYREMLEITSRPTIRYCHHHGFGYESYIGIKRGAASLHSTYNRIFQIDELARRGYHGWIAFLDADSFVANPAFDLRRYLYENRQYCIIAATGGSSTPWDVNSGVFFLNLGDIDGRLLARDWLERFSVLIDDAYLASENPVWGEKPSDQAILYECLRGTPRFLKKLKKDESGLFNYRDGQFIKQAIRASFSNMDQRMDWLRSEADRIDGMDWGGIAADAVFA